MKIGNVLSLFDGMSCGQIALNRCGIEYDNYFASEIKKDAIIVTQDNYPNTHQLGSVLDVKGKNLPKIDILIGGSPCQDFSIANKVRKGLEGKKSGLFYEYVRLLRETKPRYFFLENVGSMDSEDALIISNELGVAPVQINSELVSAQYRDRLYWTNIQGGGQNLFGSYIEQPKDKKIMLQSILETGFTDRPKARAILESESRPVKNPKSMVHRYIETGMQTIVFENKELMERIPKERIGWFNKHDIDVKEGEVRHFTQLELERLQTVPEGYTKALTRNKAASLLGDGWTVDVIAHIFNFMK